MTTLPPRTRSAQRSSPAPPKLRSICPVGSGAGPDDGCLGCETPNGEPVGPRSSAKIASCSLLRRWIRPRSLNNCAYSRSSSVVCKRARYSFRARSFSASSADSRHKRPFRFASQATNIKYRESQSSEWSPWAKRAPTTSRLRVVPSAFNYPRERGCSGLVLIFSSTRAHVTLRPLFALQPRSSSQFQHEGCVAPSQLAARPRVCPPAPLPARRGLPSRPASR